MNSKHDKRLEALHHQEKVVLYAWLCGEIVKVIIISWGAYFLLTGSIYDSSLTAVVGVIAHISIGSFAKFNLTRLDKQIQALM